MNEKDKRIKRIDKEMTAKKEAADEISRILDEEIIASRNIPKRTTKQKSTKEHVKSDEKQSKEKINNIEKEVIKTTKTKAIEKPLTKKETTKVSKNDHKKTTPTKKKRKKRKKKLSIKKISIFLAIVAIITVLSIGITKYIKKEIRIKNEKIAEEKRIKEEKKIKELVKNSYSDLVVIPKETKLLSDKGDEIGKIYKDAEFTLDGIKDELYKIKDSEYYVSYKDIKEIERLHNYGHTEYMTYKNYIPYNLNIITKEGFKLYIDDKPVIEINKEMTFPVIIKMADRYGIEFNNHLYYINNTDVEKTEENSNSVDAVADHLPVLNYHYTVNREAGETNECLQDICTTDTQVEEEIKYLSDNNYYALTMRDVYLYITGAIRIPKNSIAITIDDGWYVQRMITILNKYKLTGTLFLIGSLASPNDYVSDYLEIHSHSWNMHTPGVCNTGTHGGAILCWSREQILEDLKRSRESLNNTTVYCFPFYEHNTRAIELLKEAGFTMSFVGGERSAKVGEDPFKIPRYVIVNSTSMYQFKRYVS